jgi:hypothetical protein
MKHLYKLSRTKIRFFGKSEKNYPEDSGFNLDNRFLTVIYRYRKLRVMLSTIDILSSVEEQKTVDIKQLAKKLEIPLSSLKEILIDLALYKLVEYNEKTGKINLPNWLTKIDKEIEKLKPAIGAIILPRYQEIKIQDITIGNFTKNDLELKVRLKARLKEIAICDVS